MAGISGDVSAKRLRGKVAIITGGASGIGEATAWLFAKHGAKLVIVDIQDTKGNSLREQIASHPEIKPDDITYSHCDVTSESDVKSTVELAVSKYGKLDIMFNNAGIVGSPSPDLLSISSEDFRRVVDVNLYGSFLGAREAARVMIGSKNTTGVILFTSSMTSVLTFNDPLHAYVASKHAVVGLMKSLCVELGGHGIRVNAISPYLLATPLVTNFFEETTPVSGALVEAAVLKGVVPVPEDVAAAALFLSSDEAKYINGLNMVIDGGYSTVNPTLTTELKNGDTITHLCKYPSYILSTPVCI